MSAFLRFYTQSLKKHPKTTNAAMTGSLFGVGDAVAQIWFPSGKKESGYDVARTLRAVTYGSLIFSFIGDKWFKTLNGKIKLKNKPTTHWSNLIFRVATDQLLFAPAVIPFYFGTITLMEGKTLEDAKLKIRQNWWDILITNWAVWPIFQLFNFSIVPVQHRLLAVNVVAIFWNTFLSSKNSKTIEGEDKFPVSYPPVPE